MFQWDESAKMTFRLKSQFSFGVAREGTQSLLLAKASTGSPGNKQPDVFSPIAELSWISYLARSQPQILDLLLEYALRSDQTFQQFRHRSFLTPPLVIQHFCRALPTLCLLQKHVSL